MTKAQKIRDFSNNNTSATPQEIADACGVTRIYVYQVLHKMKNKKVKAIKSMKFSDATQGQKVISFKFDANYKLTDHLNAIFYYEQQLNTPKVQTSFPTGNLKTGITIRYDLNGLK